MFCINTWVRLFYNEFCAKTSCKSYRGTGLNSTMEMETLTQVTVEFDGVNVEVKPVQLPALQTVEKVTVEFEEVSTEVKPLHWFDSTDAVEKPAMLPVEQV